MNPNEPSALSQLRDILLKRSVKFGGPFTLASGAITDVYVDCKLTACFPPAMPLIAAAFRAKMEVRGWEPEAVGGLTVGAEPIAFAIAMESLKQKPLINAFIVRKEAKPHGRQRIVEGIDPTKGCRVVIIDDVCTAGGSTEMAITNARSVGMEVIGAICLVDREMGASQLLAKGGVHLESIFKLSDLRKVHEQRTERVLVGN